MKFKHGDLVKIPKSQRLWVCLRVNKNEARKMNCDGPGLYLFGGYWYIHGAGGHLSHKRYGKIHKLEGRKIGKARTCYAAKKTL